MFKFTTKTFENVGQTMDDLHTVPESTWQERGGNTALALFRSMAENVPAYHDFLHSRQIDPATIKTAEDLQLVPLVDKDNYLRAHPRSELCWDGNFKNNSWVISTTSGSTGVPFYFPRQEQHDQTYAAMAELYLRENFQIDKKSTLYIVGFPMGTWIGGVFTYQALSIVSRKEEYNLSIITPGIDKKAILEAVRQLGGDFDQIIIGSYAPFLKDILDDGEFEGIKWHDYDIGFIFSAEIFSEEFRDYVIRKVGTKKPYTFSLNHYGTVDLGTMAYETPLSIFIRRFALKHPELYEDIFGEPHKLPTLAQYIPELFYFEVVGEDSLVCSSNSGLPLMRYDLKDRGGVLTQTQVKGLFTKHGFDLQALLRKEGIDTHTWNLPFVYVYERSDFSVSFFGFQVYPETIRRALQRQEFEKKLTGKFTLQVTYDHEGRQKFIVNIECKQKQRGDPLVRMSVRKHLIKQLTKENSEYRETRKEYGKLTDPEIMFWPYEDEKYFKPGTKQQWVQKEQL